MATATRALTRDDVGARPMAGRWSVEAVGRVSLGEPSADGFHRSWIMLLPEGRWPHPKYGTLDLSEPVLRDMVRNFAAGARGIELALDYDHKAAEGDSKAPGWIERIELRGAQTTAQGQSPAGLWALVRWTRIGLADVRDQIYRYISAEYRPSYTNEMTGKTFKHVLIGATLTNRPFMKNLPAVQLAEAEKAAVSTRPWGQVDKACLPDSAFLDPARRRLPVYEGTGPKDARGRYTRRGKLNLSGVRAALAALHGAHTGTAMTGLPAGVAAKLERWLARYGGDDASTDSGDGGDGGASMAKRATEPMADDQELYDEADMEGDYDPDEDTHGALTTAGHTHGKYTKHSHADDGDHSEAELADAPGDESEAYAEEDDAEDAADGGADEDEEEAPAPTKKTSKPAKKAATKMSEGAGATRRLAEIEAENLRLREANEAMAVKLYEREITEKLSEAEAALGGEDGTAVFSKSFRETYRKVMLSEVVREDAKLRTQIHALVTSAAKHIVDTRSLGVSYDAETRAAGGTADAKLVDAAEKIALSEHKAPLGKLADEQRQAVLLKAAREVSYTGAE